MFLLVSRYAPAGDQPQAMARLTERVWANLKHQALPGISIRAFRFRVPLASSVRVG